jgi:hypothetical protein
MVTREPGSRRLKRQAAFDPNATPPTMMMFWAMLNLSFDRFLMI